MTDSRVPMPDPVRDLTDEVARLTAALCRALDEYHAGNFHAAGYIIKETLAVTR